MPSNWPRRARPLSSMTSVPNRTAPARRPVRPGRWSTIASRDYQDVHHDPELAKARGSQDVLMNILTTNGFVGRFVTDWAGPDATMKSIAIRLGVPNYPDGTMQLTGAVS